MKSFSLRLHPDTSHRKDLIYIFWLGAELLLFTLLWFLFNKRENLSPFTKDFRGEEHFNESIDNFSYPSPKGDQIINISFPPPLYSSSSLPVAVGYFPTSVKLLLDRSTCACAHTYAHTDAASRNIG